MTGHPLAIPPEHDGDPWTLPPIRYERVEGTEGTRSRWRIPDHEKARMESPQSSWARRSERPAGTSPERDPFRCAGCDAPLSSWARERGYVFHSAECREAHTRRT